jgi:hypothetical protein
MLRTLVISAPCKLPGDHQNRVSRPSGAEAFQEQEKSQEGEANREKSGQTTALLMKIGHFSAEKWVKIGGLMLLVN